VVERDLWMSMMSWVVNYVVVVVVELTWERAMSLLLGR
jgi:hypothetical protein